MFDSIKGCFLLLHTRGKSFLQQLKDLRKSTVGRRKNRKNPTLCPPASNFDAATPSFASADLTAQLKQVFKLIDSNGDGKISTLELGDILSRLSGGDKSTANEEAEVMVRLMDCDGDGLVDLEEFMGAVDDRNASEEDEDEGGYLMDAFLIYDTNRDGLISAKELQRVLNNLGCDHCSIKDCSRMIKGVDRDGDGFVDFEEFRSMMMVNTGRK